MMQTATARAAFLSEEKDDTISIRHIYASLKYHIHSFPLRAPKLYFTYCMQATESWAGPGNEAITKSESRDRSLVPRPMNGLGTRLKSRAQPARASQVATQCEMKLGIYFE